MSKRIPPRLAGWDLADESVRLKIDDVAGESGEDATIRTLSHSLDAHQELGYFQTENPASTPAFNVHYAHLIRTLAFEEARDFGRTFNLERQCLWNLKWEDISIVTAGLSRQRDL